MPELRSPQFLLAAVVCGVLACDGPAEVPDYDREGIERQVATRLDAVREAVVEAPDDAAVWGKLGMSFQAHGLDAEATAAYAEAERLGPNDFRWPYLAAIALETVDLRRSLELFAVADSHSPPSTSFHVSYGNALLEAGRVTEARARFEGALERDPESSQAFYGLGLTSLTDGDLEDARSQLERAAELAPSDNKIHVRLAQLYHRLGDSSSAAREEFLARAHPSSIRTWDSPLAEMEAMAVSSRSHTQRGIRLAEAGRFQEAESQFRKVLAIRPGNVRDFSNLGGALARQGRLDEAIAAYRRGLEREPGDPATLNNLGVALLQTGRIDEARGKLEQAIETDPDYAEAHGNLGDVALAGGDPEQAITRFQRALDLHPGLANVRMTLARTLEDLGRSAEAGELMREGLMIDPNDLAALSALAELLGREGEHAEAIWILHRALALAPNSSRLITQLAWELATAPGAGLRDGPAALEMATRAVGAYPNDARMLDVLAAAQAETGDFSAAVGSAERALAASRASDPEQAAAIATRLAGYRLARPYRQATRD